MNKPIKLALGLSLRTGASAAMAETWTCTKIVTSSGHIYMVCDPQ